jgi:hypothetical protein
MKKIIIVTSAALAIRVIATEIASVQSSQSPSGTKARADATAVATAQRELPPFQSIEAMQTEFNRRFEMSPGFGMSRIVRPIFRAPSPALVHNGIKYRVVPPDLIGLEDEPSVYAAREHTFLIAKTNSEVRQRFRTRSLSALETNAVAVLRAGSKVFVTPLPSTPAGSHVNVAAPDLLVVGALRASESCAKCHQCDTGMLLGAFTYSLKAIGRESPATNTVPAVSPSNLSSIEQVPPVDEPRLVAR